MDKTILIILLSSLIVSGCGVKGAPMPRRDEVFIEKTLIQSDVEEEKKKSKTTILPKKDPR